MSDLKTSKTPGSESDSDSWVSCDSEPEQDVIFSFKTKSKKGKNTSSKFKNLRPNKINVASYKDHSENAKSTFFCNQGPNKPLLMNPFDIISQYRDKIDELCGHNISVILEVIKQKKEILGGLGCNLDFVKNLMLQQGQYELESSSFKSKLSFILSLPSFEEVSKQAEIIFNDFKCESQFFKFFYPAYAYKSDVSKFVEKYSVIKIISEDMYNFNFVLPIVLKRNYPTCSIICLETNNLSKSMLCNQLQNFLKATVLTDINENVTSTLVVTTVGNIVQYLSKPIGFKNPVFFIVHCPLKWTLELDIFLAQCQDILQSNTASKLFLLLSPYSTMPSKKLYSNSVKDIALPKLSHPVSVGWRSDELKPSINYIEDICKTVLSILVLEDFGDIIALLPSSAEAEITAQLFKKKSKELGSCNLKSYILNGDKDFPRIDYEDNQDISKFNRNIFFATACAEDLRIPSIVFVVDCGLEEYFMYDVKKKTNVLKTTFISCEQAKQRKSLAGVSSLGTCYLLYSKKDYAKLPSKTYPEISLSDPVNTVIKCFQFNVFNKIEDYLRKYLSSDVMEEVLQNLKTLELIDKNKMTEKGVIMAKLPFELKYSNLILLGLERGFVFECIVLVAFLTSTCDIFQNVISEKKCHIIDTIKLHLLQHESDTLTYLYIYKSYSDSGCKEDFCKKNYFCYNVLHEIDSTINEMCNIINKSFGIIVKQVLTNLQNTADELRELIFDCFKDNLCVYTGYSKCGYRALSTSKFTHVGKMSFLYQTQNLPQFVLFNNISGRKRSVISHITSIPDSLIMKHLCQNTLGYNFEEIFEQSLSERIIGPVGEETFQNEFTEDKLLEIENEIKRETGNNMVFLKASSEEGFIHAFALPHTIDYVQCALEDIIKLKLDNVLLEERQELITLKKGKNKVNFEIKCGKGGVATSLKLVQNADLSSNIEKVSSVSDYMMNDCNESKRHPYFLSITWLRLPCSGNGVITFSTNQDFSVVQKLALKSFKILDSDVFFEVNNSTKELHVTGLPPEAEYKKLIRELNELMPDLKIENVKINHQNSSEVDQNDINVMQISISKKIQEIDLLQDCKVNLMKPKRNDKYMTVYFYSQNLESLPVAAEMFLTGIMKDDKIYMSDISYTAIVECGIHIFMPLKERLNSEFVQLKNDFAEDIDSGREIKHNFVQDPDDADTILIQYSANEPQILIFIQQRINSILNGEIINENNLKGIDDIFFTGGLKWLRGLEKMENIHISVNHKDRFLRLYGSVESCQNAKNQMFQYLKDTEKNVMLSMDLKNNALLKGLIQKYGIHLEGLIEACNLQSAFLDIRNSHLLLKGSQESIEQTGEFLKELSKSLNLQVPALEESQELCPVCVCPATGITFRLEYCRHLYCLECIQSLIDQAQFPLQCCAENCFKDLVLEDIKKILKKEPEKLTTLMENSMKHYLEYNRMKLHLCPAPDCSMFFFKDQKRTDRITCQLCNNSICLKCNVVYHEGYSCDMYQNSKVDPDYSFKVWKATMAQCKQCPNCHTAIEKVSGCNRMYCVSCKKVFCWLCVTEFPTDGAVYSHISAAHRGQLYV